MPNFEVNIDSQIPNLSKANIATLIGSSTLSNQKLYIIIDATASDDQRIAVMATSNNTLSTLALNLTTNEFGNYSSDVFTPLATGGGAAIVNITRDDMNTAIANSTVQVDTWYRVSRPDGSFVIVRGVTASSISTEAQLEGTFDGSATTYGGFGTYDIATDSFQGTIWDAVNQIVYNGVLPSDNTVGVDSNLIQLNSQSTGNTIGSDCDVIFIGQNSTGNTIGNATTVVRIEQGSTNNSIGINSYVISIEQNCTANQIGEGCETIDIKESSSSNQIGDGSSKIKCDIGSNNNIVGAGSQNVLFLTRSQRFVFGDSFLNCTIAPNLNGRKADNSGPIDFITGVTFLYNRTSPWEIRDIDRTAELLFLYVTYGDGSDPEEGWYDPATDVFTPVSSGGGVASVTGTAVDNTDPVNPVIDKQPIMYQNTGSHAQIGVSVARYGYLLGGYGVNLSVSSQAVLYFEMAGTFRGGRFRTNATQPATGSLVITLMYGSNPASLSASANIVVTIAAGSAAGIFSTANTQAISAGDYVCWRLANAATTVSAQIADGYTEFIPS